MYDARYFGELLVSVANGKLADRTRSVNSAQDGIRLSRVSAQSCTVEIDRNSAANADLYNLRGNAVRKFAQKEYVAALKTKFGKVTIIR